MIKESDERFVAAKLAASR